MENKNRVGVSAEILKSAKISFDQFQQLITELKLVLGKKFGQLIPEIITDLTLLQWMIDFNRCLQKLKNCEGFKRHIREYNQKQIQSNYLVAIIASYLLDKNVGNIVLEPPIIGKANKSDIILNYKKQKVYFECKHPEFTYSSYSSEHSHMFSILRNYIKIPHQVSITYKKPLSDQEIHDLGVSIMQRSNLITGDGRIIDNEDIEVQILQRGFINKRLVFYMSMISKNIYNNCSYPGHIYGASGIMVSLAGPKVNSEKFIRNTIKRSRIQSPNNESYVLVIDGSFLLGDLTENVRVLSNAFQPKINTRFSAAIIVTHYSELGKSSPSLDFKYVSNPYAKFPVKKDFDTLFLHN